MMTTNREIIMGWLANGCSSFWCIGHMHMAAAAWSAAQTVLLCHTTMPAGAQGIYTYAATFPDTHAPHTYSIAVACC
jgi:hypothetical protein